MQGELVLFRPLLSSISGIPAFIKNGKLIFTVAKRASYLGGLGWALMSQCARVQASVDSHIFQEMQETSHCLIRSNETSTQAGRTDPPASIQLFNEDWEAKFVALLRAYVLSSSTVCVF